MSQLLAVFGATGQQGGSLIEYVLKDSVLSGRYKLRAITRDIHSTKAKLLTEKDIEVVAGDVNDRASLEAALTNVHTVFAMTANAFGPDALDIECNHAKTIADVAVAKGAAYLIFSTLPSVSDISKGKYTALAAFDAKAKAEAYIRGLPIKSAFYSPGSFMENFLWQAAAWTPKRMSDGTWELSQHVSAETQFPLINASGDTGKFVGAILADPDKYEGETLCAATALYTVDEIVNVMGKVTGKKIVYKQVPVDDFRKGLEAQLPAAFAAFVEVVVQLFSYLEEFGYYGSQTEESVAWAVENIRGELTSLEEYLRAHAFQFK